MSKRQSSHFLPPFSDSNPVDLGRPSHFGATDPRPGRNQLDGQDSGGNAVGDPPAARVIARDATGERNRATLWIALMVILAVAAMIATRSAAQEAAAKPAAKPATYDTIAMPGALADEKMVKRIKTTVKTFAGDGSGNRQWVDGYFTAYLPALMAGPEGVKHIPEVVDEVNYYTRRANSSPRPEIRQAILAGIYRGMLKVATGNHQPSARVSAIVMLSRLDAQPANNATRTPPLPLAPVLPLLVGLYQDESNVDGIRAAALQGIHRHVSYGFARIPADTKAKIAAEMNKLLDSPPPADRDTDAHAYLQRFAVDILNTLQPAGDSALGIKLISISSKPSSHDLIALHSASRIGQMGKSLTGKVDKPDSVLQSWSRRALKAFQAEHDRLTALERPAPAKNQPKDPKLMLEPEKAKSRPGAGGMGAMRGMGGMEDDNYGMEMGEMGGMDDMYTDSGMGDDYGMEMMGMGGMGGAIPAKPQPPQVLASRRRLNQVLQQLHEGVTGSGSAGIPREKGGLLASVTDAQKESVETWVTAMEPIVEGLNDKSLDDLEKYMEGLQTQIDALTEIVGEEEAAEEPEPAADADAGGDPPMVGDTNNG